MRLNDLICDGVIFQANKPIRIFGTGGGKLEIELCSNTFSGVMVGTAWCVELPSMNYGGPYELRVILDGRKQIIRDVYIGNVYILAGQSNMQFKLKESDYPQELYVTDPLLRFFHNERPEPGENFLPQDGWVGARADLDGDFSCIGYFVGRYLREKMGYAVGFITCYQGAANIQAYLPEKAFENQSFNIPEEECKDHYPWNSGHSQLYNFQVKKTAPFSASGIIWYQGESNESRAESKIYGDMLLCLINSWREVFCDSDLPFTVVQLPDFLNCDVESWKKIQRSQAEISTRAPFVKVVVSRDVCENTEIHPKKKYELSERIAKALLS